METIAPVAPATDGQSLRPKLWTVFREGYDAASLRADAVAGLTVAIVALPLSMAIAIACGVGPERGLTAAIVGGFVVSALGGSRHQIAGPAGAFIVLVAATLTRHGVDGLLLATMLSGVMLTAVGLLRLGGFIKFVPYPVTVGFTAGIALIIFASQISGLFGLTLAHGEPAPLLPKLQALWAAAGTTNASAVAIAALTVGVILLQRRFRPTWPGMLIAVAAATMVATFVSLDVATIQSRFGGLPHGLPMPRLPAFDMHRIIAVLPDAAAFTLLGGIESLLSAVVADSMTGRRHRSNAELVAQGAANVASALFGGLVVTGTIARTATNVRAGGRTPVAGMLHSAFLLVFMLVAAPVAGFIPLAALAGVLAVVAWNMAERHAFVALLKVSRGDAVVLLATFLITVFYDLALGILVGFSLAALMFLHGLAESVEVSADEVPIAQDRDIVVYRISGAFFFGATAAVAAALGRLSVHPKAYVIDFSDVAILDSSAAAMLIGFVRRVNGQGVQVYLVGARRPVLRVLASHGLDRGLAHYRHTLAEAVTDARAAIAAAA